MPELPLTELAAWWRGRPARAGACRVLAVDGRSGSGKTTLASTLIPLVPEAVSVAMDDVYPGWDGLAGGIRIVVEQLLAPLATGAPAGVPCWDWVAQVPRGWCPVPAAPLILLDGVGSGAARCAPYLCGLVFVAASDVVRRDRALARDGAAYEPNWDRWAAQEEAYLRADRPDERADLIVDGALTRQGSAAVPVIADLRHA